MAILFSIAASQILLALALVALLLSKAPLRLPRIWLPLALFLLLTLVSLAFSGDVVHGLPQVRKVYVYSILLVIYSALRDMRMIRWLFLSWAGVGALEAARGLVQFAAKVSEARASAPGDYGSQHNENPRSTSRERRSERGTQKKKSRSLDDIFSFCELLF